MALITPPLILTPFAAAGDQSVIPQTDPNGFVNFSTGYTPDYEINLGSGDPQAKAVERGIQNYMFNALTTTMQAWQTSNRPPWYSSFPGGYSQYAEVVYPNNAGVPVPYRSLVNGNVATPGASPNWEYIQGSGEMISNIPMPSGGPGGPGVMLINIATDFNTLTKPGTFQFQSDAVVSGSPNTPVNGGNQAAAGMLEVTSWVNLTATYYTQFFRDRNGLGFMRGGTNGAWSAWKIWANATQFVVGEIRIWSGTASQAAVTAAWGPGWHLCDGTLGTPNLQGQFIVGASGSLPVGSNGGTTSYTISAANMPVHNHVINITDNGHSHGLTQNPHTHGVYDPGHSHAIYDPGHSHSVIPTGPNGGNQAFVLGSTAVTPQSTGVSGTGISIYGNGTGVAVNPGSALLAVNGSTTGITASSNNAGGGSPITIVPPYYAFCYVMYTGA